MGIYHYSITTVLNTYMKRTLKFCLEEYSRVQRNLRCKVPSNTVREHLIKASNLLCLCREYLCSYLGRVEQCPNFSFLDVLESQIRMGG